MPSTVGPSLLDRAWRVVVSLLGLLLVANLLWSLLQPLLPVLVVVGAAVTVLWLVRWWRSYQGW